MNENDRVRIKHMIEAGREAIRSVEGRGRVDLEADRIWAFGLVKCFEIIGEAAARISKETRNSLPDIPWRQIIEMRNRLVHVYFEIDFDQVWMAVTEDLPPLLTRLERILEERSR